MTPELAEVIKRIFRGMHFLAWLRPKEVAAQGGESDVEAAIDAARNPLMELLGETDSDAKRRGLRLEARRAGHRTKCLTKPVPGLPLSPQAGVHRRRGGV